MRRNGPVHELKRILRLYHTQRLRLFIFTFLSLLLALLAVGQIQLFSAFLDSLSGLTLGAPFHFLASPVAKPFACFVLLLALQAVLGGAVRLLGARLSNHLSCDLKNQLATTLSALPYASLESREIQDRLSRIRESQYSPFAFWQDAFKLVHCFVQFCGMLLIMAQTALWPAALVLLLVAGFVPVLIRAGAEDYQAYRQASTQFRKAAYVGRVLYHREYADERRTFGHTDYFNSKWQKDFEAGRLLSKAATKKNFLKLRAASIGGLVIFVLCALLLLIPLRNQTLSIGLYIAILTTFFQILEFLKNELYYLFEEISGEYSYIQELGAVLFTAPTLQSELSTASLTRLPETSVQTIMLRDVSFTYPNSDRPVLHNINLTLEAGRTYALVGSNGAGKSTLIHLLSALYRNYSGTIQIDGQELRTLDPESLRGKLAIAEQKSERFALSVEDFLSLGRKQPVTEQELLDLPAGLQLADLLSGLDQGLQTPLGRLEATARDLSGGQWQRLVIARALLREADLFIFDEPTAPLDPNTERAIYRELLAYMKQGIGILITHRLGSIAEVDNIILLEDGKIAAVGSHEQLMQTAPLYAEMYEAQRNWYE